LNVLAEYEKMQLRKYKMDVLTPKEQKKKEKEKKPVIACKYKTILLKAPKEVFN
jgi:predicted secreted acid phosphatase